MRKLNRYLPLICLALLALPARAAAGYDWGKATVDAVNALITKEGGVFVAQGITCVAWAGVLKILWGVFMNFLQRFEWIASRHHQPLGVREVILTMAHIFILTTALNGWMNPVVGAHSLHNLPMDITGALANQLDNGQLDKFQQYVTDAATNIEKPNPLMILDVLIYIFILADMAVLSFVTFILTAFSFVGNALFVVITPLFAWCTFFRRTESWFWNCIQNILSFSMYRLMSSVILYILSSVMVTFFAQAMKGNYTLAQWTSMLIPVVVLTAMFVFSLLIIPLLCASIFNGAGAVGQAAMMAIGRAGAAMA